ncbi:hypothetical protein Patl1_05135 [Pistacia atlantica]|uniref:Uncharacterized protein n=1 Tax=Pistacia atlantica TaxID=434234 RepID=A0ACC1BVL8_9ROSI|nr:hypothetical protein Patl1_05135 [Pistacia atlantica]
MSKLSFHFRSVQLPVRRDRRREPIAPITLQSMASRKVEEKLGRRGRACVVVLGDLGRSPRMQYHALSLARQVLITYYTVPVA